MKNQDLSIQKPASVLLLVGLSAAQALLALFQWMEVLVVRSGGSAVCNINQFLNCETVWNSTLATTMHHWTGLPVAGLGLLWGLVAFSLSLLLVARLLAKNNTQPAIIALRAIGGLGATICLALAIWSAISGALCATCVASYVLILGFTFVAFRNLKGAFSPQSVKPALAWTISIGAVLYALLLVPGLRTPSESKSTLSEVRQGSAAPFDASDLKKYIESLGTPEKQTLADSIDFYKHASPVNVADVQPRFRFGPADAPVQIVDFTDIRCPHCRHLEETLKNLKRIVPAGAMSIESRQFPLDSECNRVITMSDGTGVRCLAAKVQICLEGSPAFWAIRTRLFEEQENLTQARVWTIAQSADIARPALEACVASPETNAKLNEDIRFAMRYRPSGTPLVLVNGRQGPPFDGFLLSMVMARGNPSDPSFAALPAPNMATQ